MVMVRRETLAYLLIGEDNNSKDTQIKKLKERFLKKETEDFNLDLLYSEGLTLKYLQERLLSLPVRSEKRLIIIKNCLGLKDEVKEFLVEYIKTPYPKTVLILDIDKYNTKDGFLSRLFGNAQVIRFAETRQPNTFDLAHQIGFKKADTSLKILNQLLKNGEKPERILGGLRAAWQREIRQPQELRKRLKMLLDCDIDIKTGKIKPGLALERFIVSLCGGPRNFPG
jgi:DNA polymerase III delta subunit